MFDTYAFSISSVFPPASYFTDFGKLASDILMILVSVAGALAIIFIIISGIKLVTASGDPKKISAATTTLTYSLIGLAVVILAFVIIQVVQAFFKTNIIGGGGPGGGPPGGFSFTLGNPTISGTTATFSVASNAGGGAGVGSILYIKDLATAVPIPTAATSISWSGTAGAHSVVISGFGVDVSNTVSFTITFGGADTDSDGFTDLIEAYIGSNPTKACSMPGNTNAWPPDYNNDGKVSLGDIPILGAALGSKVGDANYSKRTDLNADGKIDSQDQAIVTNYWNQSCTPGT